MDILNINNQMFYILLFLCPGFLSMRIYFIDKTWNEMSFVNVFYGSLIFSMFSYVVVGVVYNFIGMEYTGVFKDGPFAFAATAIPVAVLLGLVWRCCGHPWLHGLLNWLKVTNEDNKSTPWMGVFNNPKLHISQITVHLKDGSALRCDETKFYDNKKLRDVGIYSHYASAGGDICFIATHYMKANSKEWSKISQINVEPPWGIKMQWIPAREIARVEARAVAVTLAFHGSSRVRWWERHLGRKKE